VAKKKRPRIDKIRKAIQQQLRQLERNLHGIDALIACGANHLAAGRHWYRKLVVDSELVRQQKILYHSDSKSIPDRISLYQALREALKNRATINGAPDAAMDLSWLQRRNCGCSELP
jgi:IS5 family transposase